MVGRIGVAGSGIRLPGVTQARKERRELRRIRSCVEIAEHDQRLGHPSDRRHHFVCLATSHRGVGAIVEMRVEDSDPCSAQFYPSPGKTGRRPGTAFESCVESRVSVSFRHVTIRCRLASSATPNSRAGLLASAPGT